MDYAVVISAIVLGLSVLATIAKFLDWFVHSDPKTMVRTTRWMLLLLVLACIPLLILAIANQQWPAAMLIGAGMLIVQEALEVLGLETAADEGAIRAAHKRLLGLVHPDHSGSAYLAKKVQQARDTLLAPSREWLSSSGETSAPRNRAAKR